jgi:hypothetical protein
MPGDLVYATESPVAAAETLFAVLGAAFLLRDRAN